eukprot:gb/GEZN01012587.1/.p1 GENE.gb/GEZN01012587.1/~~gb/GEZN01012587.1/.p1  ORF type:complete len:354 (-),score=36.70 gb/GEZN01012587.1/:7-999(-)
MGNTWKLLADSTFPLMSWFEGKKFGKSISEILGPDVQIEDLWVPFFAITTNVSKADAHIHRVGSLWKAVRASMTVMGYLPPMFLDGCILIDGGYTNNLPVDVCRDIFRPRFIICHDIETKDSPLFQQVSNYGDSLNGWWLLYRRICQMFYPMPTFKIPGYSDIIGSLIYINHNRTVRLFIQTDMMDLYIRPDLGNTKMLDFHKMEDIVAIGLENSRAPLRAFRAKHSPHLPPVIDTSQSGHHRIENHLSGRLARSLSATEPLHSGAGSLTIRRRVPADKIWTEQEERLSASHHSNLQEKPSAKRAKGVLKGSVSTSRAQGGSSPNLSNRK